MPLFGTSKNPKGPDLENLQSYKVNLSGVDLSLKLPKNNDNVFKGVEKQGPLNLYDSSIYHKHEDDPSNLAGCGLVDKNWLFHGLPIFSGDYIGRLCLTVSVCHMPSFQSLFRPHRFISAIQRFMYKTVLNSVQIKEVYNNTSKVVNGVKWFNQHSQTTLEGSTVFRTVWQVAISDEHLLTILFDKEGEEKSEGLKAAFSKVIDLVMNSVKLKLPNDIKTRKEEIEKKFPYESLPKSLPPYEFEYYYPTNVLDLVRKVSAKYNHEITPDMQEKFDAEVSQLEELEKQKQQATHQKNLDHHMRFEELEAEDRKRYLAEKEKT